MSDTTQPRPSERRAAEQEQRVLDVIETFIDANGYSPSIREISEATDLWISTTAKVLGRLRDRGAITFVDHQARTIRLT